MVYMGFLAVHRSKNSLKAKFARLGNFAGKTEAEMVASVGPPKSRSAQSTGFLLQWMESGYHIAVLFDAQGKALKVTHEHMA